MRTTVAVVVVSLVLLWGCVENRRFPDTRQFHQTAADLHAKEKAICERRLELGLKMERLFRKQDPSAYDVYRQSTTKLTDQMLRVLSATEVGVTYVKYGEMLQDLQYEWNKFESQWSPVWPEQAVPGFRPGSYLNLEYATGKLKDAYSAWKSYHVHSGFSVDVASPLYRQEMNYSWELARDYYNNAVAVMARASQDE